MHKYLQSAGDIQHLYTNTFLNSISPSYFANNLISAVITLPLSSFLILAVNWTISLSEILLFPFCPSPLSISPLNGIKWNVNLIHSKPCFFPIERVPKTVGKQAEKQNYHFQSGLTYPPDRLWNYFVSGHKINDQLKLVKDIREHRGYGNWLLISLPSASASLLYICIGCE